MIVRNTADGQWMVIVSFSKKDKTKIIAMMDALKNEFPQIASLNYVVNTKLNDTIFDLDIVNYCGNPYIIESVSYTHLDVYKRQDMAISYWRNGSVFR